MIENPPAISEKELLDAYFQLYARRDSSVVLSQVEKLNDEYAYWSEVKYKVLPPGITPKQMWCYLKASRVSGYISVWPKYGLKMKLTNQMQRMCHKFDMNLGGSWGKSTLIPEEGKEQYLLSSLMEEAISSSQMEGASTTRKVAKEMLRKKVSPRDKSQRMIFNNYRTIRFIVENKQTPLTEELLLKVHRLMTENTLEHPDHAGCFRQSDDVVVEDGITHEVVHTPPCKEDIPEFVASLCDFFNEEKPEVFIHPIIRGIIIHFMVAYMHPFVDGNGRTARALFYWYMLRQGYWLTEYLSISRIISRSKKTYEKAYLCVEADEMDLGYFIVYNLRVLDLAFGGLQEYINRKLSQKRQAQVLLRIGGINERQSEIVRMYQEMPSVVFTVKDVQAKFGITPTTAKSDIVGLLQRGILAEISLNKVKKGYIKGEKFDEVVNGCFAESNNRLIE